MNKVVSVLLLLSVVVAASATAIGNSDAIDGIASAEREIRPADQVYEAMEEHITALKDAPRTRESRCVEVKECTNYVVVSKYCIKWVWWKCTAYREVKECSRWVTVCRPKRGGIEESPVQLPGSDTESDDSKPTDQELQTAVEELQSESMTSFRNIYDQKVVKADKYQRLGTTSGENANSEDEKSFAVVVTLTDGRRFAITHGRKLWNDKTSAILKADYVTKNWQFVESKTIQFSKVEDYVRQSDSSNSSSEAAEKMMALD